MEPSYSLLSPVKSPRPPSISPLEEEHYKDNLVPPRVGDESMKAQDASGSLSGKFLSPLRPQLFRGGAPSSRPPLWRVVKTPLEMALFPLAAIAYLTFCYTVHGTVVPVNTYGLYSVIPRHLTTIKGGITSITIIIISIALYPIYFIVSNLKSEEFFRILASHNHGVQLETVNHISTPSFGNIDKMMAMRRHDCSKYYILGIVSSILIWIVRTLGPVTIDTVLADGELMAFAIGAVTPQSVLNGSYTFQPNFNASLNAGMAASITWAEIELGVQYSFGMSNSSESDYAAFIAPVPLDLPSTTSARWLTDVIGLNPTCSWSSTNLTAMQLPYNSTYAPLYLATAYLPDFSLDVQVNSDDIGWNSPFATIKDPTYYVTNHTTQAPAVDGSTVFLLGQCQSGCEEGVPVDFTLDLSSVNNTFTIALTDRAWNMAILVCLPNITIETREVRNDGYGVFNVQPPSAGAHLMSQGNLNPIQTSALFSIATMSLTQGAGSLDSGSNTQYASLGSQVQGDVLFGKAQFDNLPGITSPDGTTVTITPAPIENITQGYTQIIQSATKSYLAGYLGTAYVPGRVSSTEVVFAASVLNLAVATVAFVLLAVFIVVAHFRSNKGIEFTLVNIAAAVYGSELPAHFARVKTERTSSVHEQAETEVEGNLEMDSISGKNKLCHPPEDHRDVLEMLGERQVYMHRRADGSPVLHIG